MHIGSMQTVRSFLTQFCPKWVQNWLFLPILATLMWGIGYGMPWEQIYLYPIQSILLTCPLWILFLWPIWTLIASRRQHSFQKWTVLGISTLTSLWALGVFSLSNAEVSGKTVLVANVNAYAGQAKMLQGYLSVLGADAIILVEKRAEEVDGYVRKADDFHRPVKKPSHHAAVFCKTSCEAWVSPQIGSNTMAMSMALYRVGQGVCLIAVHAPPPTPIDATGMRPYIEYLTAAIKEGRLKSNWEVCQKGDAIVVAGDLNAVPFSWAHRQLLGAGLIDAQRHSGLWGATWPSDSDEFIPAPLFRIDHVLHHPSISIRVRQTRVPKSDHQGLLLQIGSAEF